MDGPSVCENYSLLLQRAWLAGAERLALRVLVSSGEPLPEQLFRQLQSALPVHMYILNIYGCTEVSADATSCCLQDPTGEAPSTSKGSVKTPHTIFETHAVCVSVSIAYIGMGCLQCNVADHISCTHTTV